MKTLKINKSVVGVFYPKKRVLKFTGYSNYISDEEVHMLFGGILRLIKRQIEEKVYHKYKKIIDNLKNELRKYEIHKK